MELGADQLLRHTLWSCSEYIKHGYGRALDSDKAADVCRYALSETGAKLSPGLMFHASILRVSLPASVDGVTYSMQIVHEVERGADGEVKARNFVGLWGLQCPATSHSQGLPPAHRVRLDLHDGHRPCGCSVL